ncbi:MAG: VWA domain-containing protein [Chthoniobacterales bacterium]|nr:VWA domain-containing protein [Chthoniobacterales bacterium]
MSTQLTEIAFILDRSGSMKKQLGATISGFNHFLSDQRETPGLARFTLVLFDDCYEVPYASIPINEVVDLDRRSFVPRGTTALLDAVARTIDELRARLMVRPESQRPGQVIVAILTDGLENASQHFTHREVSERIAHQRDVCQWQFFFLGANQDAIATAAAMNIHSHAAMNFAADDDGLHVSSRSISRKMTSLRKQAAGESLSIAEEQDLKSSLSDIGREEEKGMSDGEA